MTYTAVLLVTRKSGVPPSAFKQHWESAHIPLLKSIVGRDFPLSHTRHYIERDLSTPTYPANILYGTQEDFAFDAVAVFTFANKEHWERFMAKYEKNHEAKRLIDEDHEKFMDRERLRAVFIGDTRSTGRDGGEVGWRFVGSV